MGDVVRVIWKFPLRIPDAHRRVVVRTDDAKIERVLSFGEQEGMLVCWAIVRPEPGYRDEAAFYVFNTGTEVPALAADHLATVSVPSLDSHVGVAVWHIFSERARERA